MKQTERKNITQPSAWWVAFETQAKAEGLTLSEWVGECCMANLPKATQKRLPQRIGRGKPNAFVTGGRPKPLVV